MKAFLWTRAVARGVFGTSRFWLVVAIFMGAVKLKDKFLNKGEELVFREELKPGQSFLVTNLTADATMEA